MRTVLFDLGQVLVRWDPLLPFARHDPVAVERFWSVRGWTRVPVDMGWSFASRADLEAVVRIELPPAAAEAALAGHTGTTVDYAVNLWWRTW